MKLWIDDLRPAPEGYVWCKSVNEAKHRIRRNCEEIIANSTNKTVVDYYTIEVIDCDHDLGDYAADGGDGVKLLDWLEGLMKIINEPLCQCPHCQGTGYVGEVKKQGFDYKD